MKLTSLQPLQPAQVTIHLDARASILMSFFYLPCILYETSFLKDFEILFKYHITVFGLNTFHWHLVNNLTFSCWLLQIQGLFRQGRPGRQVRRWHQEGLRCHWPGQERLHWGGWAEVGKCLKLTKKIFLFITNTWLSAAISDCSCRTSLLVPEHWLMPRQRPSWKLATLTVTARSEWMVRNTLFIQCIAC